MISANPIDVIVGNNLRTIRMKSGCTQERLGNACGVTFQQIQKYEAGDNRISASRIVQFSGVLRCDVIEFFVGVKECSADIERKSSEELRLEHRLVSGCSALPRDIQLALANLMDACVASIAIGMSTTKLMEASREH